MGLPSRIYGVKWEPVAAMIALLFVGFWLVYRPMKTVEGAYVVEVRVANERGIIEAYTPEGAAAPVFRLALRHGHEHEMSGEEVTRIFGAEVYQTLITRPSNALFRLFNITSWGSMAWVAIGMGGAGSVRRANAGAVVRQRERAEVGRAPGVLVDEPGRRRNPVRLLRVASGSGGAPGPVQRRGHLRPEHPAHL